MKPGKQTFRFLLSTILGAYIALPCSSLAEEPQLPEEKPENLFKYIQEEDVNTNWQLWPGTTKFYEGSRPHGTLLTTYVNDIALKALNNGTAKFPQGSIILKENYSSDKRLKAVTAMYRLDGYNPGAGDWYWLKYDAEGNIEADGKVMSCINCHSSAEETDWVFTKKP